MIHFRLLALGLAASTASVALAAGDVESCAVTCRRHAFQNGENGGGCKWDVDKRVCKNDEFAGKVADCAKKTCFELAEKVNKLSCNECGSKKTLKQCQKVERKCEHKGPVGGHHHDHGESAGKYDPDHKHDDAVREQQGKHGVKPYAKHHNKHVGTVHSVPFNAHADQQKLSTVFRQYGPYGDMPITQRHGKHRVEPGSKVHHGEHEHDHRGKKAPKDFNPGFVPAYARTAEPKIHHGRDKGTPPHEGQDKTSAEAPHGAHGSDKKAPDTPKEGSKKQPEKQPRPVPKSGGKGNPSAKSAAGHTAETPKVGVTAAQCEAQALNKSKCHKDDRKCICTSQGYHGSLMRCGAAANTAAFEAGVDKYLHDCQKAGHPVAPLPKGKQGGKPQPGAHGEAGKNPASSNSTYHGSKDKEPAGASPADSNSPPCAIPCISVALKKTKTNCTTVACQCTYSVFQMQFTACMRQTCNKVDYAKTIDVGKQACNAANNTATGGDGSNNDNPNSNNNPGTHPPSTPGVQSNTSAFGLRSSVGAVLAGAIGVAFATLL